MSDFLKCCRFVWTTCMGSCWPQSTMLTMAELLRLLHFSMLITAMLSLLWCFLRQGVLQELPVVRLNSCWRGWPYKNLWTELEPTRSPFGHHRQVSGSHVRFPITLKNPSIELPNSQVFVANYKWDIINPATCLQRFYNAVLLIPCYQQRDWSEMESCDVGFHIHVRFCR